VFPHEPLLEAGAPVIEGQLLETLLMNYVSTDTVLASRAVRMVIAAEGRSVVDSGMRRMPGYPEDAPAIDLACKLSRYREEPRLKSSPGKKLLPGRKQAWRFRDADGCYSYDEICRDTGQRDGEPLLVTAVRNGQPVAPEPDIEESREQVKRALDEMGPALLALGRAEKDYDVRLSAELDPLYRDAIEVVSENGPDNRG